MKDWSDHRKRLLTLFFPALLGPSQLLLFGPFAIYSGNEGEFAASFWALAAPWLWALALVTGTVIAIGMILPGWLFTRYQAVLFTLGVLLWLQGNVLVADYGLLYGEGLALDRHVWRAPYEIGLWAAGLALAAYFARAVSTVASFASQLLIALQAGILAVSTVSAQKQRQPDADGDTFEWEVPPGELYRLSRDRNVIHFVLDGFLSDVFPEMLEQERATFDRDFSGFIFFADHLGAFPTTRASMPAMMTGFAYRNEMPVQEFLRAHRDRSLFHALAGDGYVLHSISGHQGEHPPRSLAGDVTRYTIPTPYGSYRDYLDFAGAQVLDLSLFRHTPHGLKAWIYQDGNWLAQSWYEEQRPADLAARAERPASHAAFLEEFARRLTIAEERPVYKFIHVMLPHPPVVVEGGCSFVGRHSTRWQRYAAQARCALTVVQQVLDRMRALGVYESSAIVLTSDHGWQLRRRDHPLRSVRTPVGHLDRVGAAARPLLLLKPPGRSGPMQISYAPTTITDIPATILDLAGSSYSSFPGQPAVRIDPQGNRERTFAYHSWRNADWSRPYLDVLHVFSINGRSLDPSAWTYRKAIFDPSEDFETQVEDHEAGWFAVERGPDGPFRWGDVQVVTYIPHDARAFSIAARQAPTADFPQSITVRVDGQVIARHELAGDSWQTLRHALPARGGDRNPFCLELLVDPPWYDDDRRLGLMYRDLEWTR